MTDEKFPKPEEIQKEFESFVKNRFGKGVQIFTSQMGGNIDSDISDDSTTRQADKDQETFELDFDYTPKQVKDFLDRFVVKQDEAKIALSIALCDHYNHAKNAHSKDKKNSAGEYDYAKQNILLLGPTGVGKTYLIRKAAELIGVPFVKADATRFSETGYMGANVDDLIRDLVQQADGDIEKAQYGIIYLDEADKLASQTQSNGRDVNGRGVQFGLLRLMEESEIDLRSGNDMQSQIQAIFDLQKGSKSKKKVNTKHILFIVSGAFSGLEKLIEKRLSHRPIGFQNSHPEEALDSSDIFQNASTQDFIDYGFEPEFIGRLPVRVACEHLTAEDMLSILTDSEGSILRQYKNSFLAYQIDVNFTDKALKLIAEAAVEEKTGARSLLTICEKLMLPFKFHLPSAGISELSVTEECVRSPEAYLKSLLESATEEKQEGRKVEAPLKRKAAHAAISSMKEKHELESEFDRFEQYFQDNFDIKIKLTNDLRSKIANYCDEKTSSVMDFCKSHFASYEYGLLLVQQFGCGNEEAIEIELAAFDDPETFLERLIRTCYRKD